MRSSFIKNYNNFSNDNKKLDVDRLTLFMLLDKTEWFVLGAKEGCFTFWINLEPDRFIELIDGQSLSRRPRYMEKRLKSYFNAASKSSIMSFTVSNPMDNLIVSGPAPALILSALES